ncbi:MAG: hypothetical protein ABIK07_07735 [Planctomycetota bacterium]
MGISDASFDNEKELEGWTFSNCNTFFGDCIFLSGFRITTPAGKHGIPDGFAFNFSQRAWWFIECELLSHGVWPHIAEQVTRFVVAVNNPITLRIIRDKLFEKILEDNMQLTVAKALNTTTDRLLQQLELFLEGVDPSLAIFIDDTNQDLTDFCNALDTPTEVYRIRKLFVNDQVEYYSPDKSQPAIVTDPEPSRSEGSTNYDVIEELGGGEVINSRNKCFKLHDGRIVKVQFSKLHNRHQAYWYGIRPSTYEQAKDLGCNHFVFVMGDEGFVVVPLKTIDEYLETTYISKNPDGTIRHYHIHISPPPDVLLKGYGNAEDIDVTEYFSSF